MVTEFTGRLEPSESNQWLGSKEQCILNPTAEHFIKHASCKVSKQTKKKGNNNKIVFLNPRMPQDSDMCVGHIIIN